MSNKNVGTNVGINKTEKAMLGILIGNPEKTAAEMAGEVGGNNENYRARDKWGKRDIPSKKWYIISVSMIKDIL